MVISQEVVLRYFLSFFTVEPVVHVKGKGEKGHFKNAILDKIEEKTNMKIDSIEAKLAPLQAKLAGKFREKGEKGTRL